MRWMRVGVLFLVVVIAGPAIRASSGDVRFSGVWYQADRSSVGLAPDPATTPAAVVQVYAARTFNWRGVFAVHTWIATKPRNADSYAVHQITSWNDTPAPLIATPDRKWFGNAPWILAQLRGPPAAMAIEQIKAAVAAYPFAGTYRMWPGPNSNTFTAWVIRQVPTLQAALPSTAIGKDYLVNRSFAPAPSGTGYQLSLYGVLGILVARREGLEINLLGLVFGIDPTGPAIELPGIGRIGRSQLESHDPNPRVSAKRGSVCNMRDLSCG